MPLDIVLVICFIISCKSQWIVVNDTHLLLPRGDVLMACGTFNDSIFIFGGYWFNKQLLEYIPSRDIMIDHGKAVLHDKTFGHAQYYTQWNHMLYITSFLYRQHAQHSISIYDLSTNNFVDTASSILIPNDISRSPGCCITTSEEFIFITGGSMTHTLQLFEFKTNKWHTGAPMQDSREDHACVVVFDFLYVIAGVNRSTIEKISIRNFETQPWEPIGSFTSIVAWPGCVLHHNTIWVVGGADRGAYWENWQYSSLQYDEEYEALDTVYIIRAIDDSITLLAERLPYGINRAATVILGNTLYVFGGTDVAHGVDFNTWLKYENMSNVSQLEHGNITINKSNYSSDKKVAITFVVIGLIVVLILFLVSGLFYWHRCHTKLARVVSRLVYDLQDIVEEPGENNADQKEMNIIHECVALQQQPSGQNHRVSIVPEGEEPNEAMETREHGAIHEYEGNPNIQEDEFVIELRCQK
eukprot:212984_1